MKPDYGTATFEEISSAFNSAVQIADIIKAHPNPAAQNLIKELVALIAVQSSGYESKD